MKILQKISLIFLFQISSMHASADCNRNAITKLPESLKTAIHDHDTNSIEDYFKNYINHNPNVDHDYIFEVLQLAIQCNDEEITELLLRNYPVDLKKFDSCQNNTLLNATFYECPKIISLLLEFNADVNAVSPTGFSPLMGAAFHGHSQVAEVLLNNGARVDLQDVDGDTALHLAANCNKKSIVELLITAGANKSIVNNDNKTAYELTKSQSIRKLLNPESNTNCSIS